MSDAMLTELYRRAFQEKAKCELMSGSGNEEMDDRRRQVAIEKKKTNCSPS